MARLVSHKKSGASSAPSSKQKTPTEMQKWYEENKDKLKSYANAKAAKDVLQLRDVTKSAQRTITTLSKDTVITYLKSVTSYESQLRNVSWYLFYRSQVYQRIITYYSVLEDLDARLVIPSYDLTKSNNDTKILKSYYNTLNVLNHWNINNEFVKIWFTCLIQDVSYNVAYYNDTSLYLLPLPADYCRIVGQYAQSGDYQFAMDMTYFRGTNNWLIEAWGEPFTSMYSAYGGKSANKWQIIPEQYSACFKYRSYDWETICPPFSGLFLSLINLEDISDVQAIADQQEIYKMIYLKLETITGSKNPDDWEVSPEIITEYFDRMINEALPDYTSAAIVPGDLNVIDFSNTDKTSDTNKVLNTTKSVFNISGGSQILNSATITGTTAFNAACKIDTEFSIATLLPQVQGWFNRILPYIVSDASQVEFLHTGRLTKDDFQDRILKLGQNGLPVKLGIMSLSGLNEIQTLSLSHLEDILDLPDMFSHPLQTSYTSTGSTTDGGAPTKSDTQITDDGEKSRDKSDKSNG